MSLKKLLSLTCALLACATIAVPTAAEAKGFKNLSFAGNYQERHPTTARVWLPWFEETKKKFDGKLSFTYFSQGTLYPEKEAMQAVSDGRVDFGCVRGSMFPGQMNLMSGVEIPGIAPNAIVGSLVAQELVEKFPAEVVGEFPPNTVPYVSWASASYQLHTLKPVKTMEELKGKKIIVWDSVTMEIVKALGANPVRMTSTDTYLSLSKAMADGVYCPIAPLRSMKISEAAKYHLVFNMGVGTFNIVAYKPLWDDFPADMKAWLEESGGMKMSLAIGKSLEDGQAEDIVWMEGQGHEFYWLNDQERAAFLAPMQQFEDAWIKDCKDRNLPKVDEILAFIKERSAYHTEQMRAGAYGEYKM